LVKLTDLVDDDGWYANSPDNIFYSANCGKAKDYIIINGVPIATFRSDNVIWDFKNLSVREIIPEEKYIITTISSLIIINMYN